MTLDEYQKEALVTAVFKEDKFQDLAHWVFGITGEAGEIAEKIKKIVRDKDGKLTDKDKEEIIKEIGDVLWYLAVLSEHLDIKFNEVARRNITKLRSRQSRGKIGGSGDNR